MPLQLLSIILVLSRLHHTTASMAKPGCEDKCGNITIPYPFGIGSDCYLDKGFEVECDPFMSFASIPTINGFTIRNISMDYIAVYGGATGSCYNVIQDSKCYSLNGQFSYSHIHNIFVAIGCNKFAYITDPGNVSFTSGCALLCPLPSPLFYSYNESSTFSCSGIGCCRTTIPKDITSFEVQIDSIDSFKNSSVLSPCSVAYIVEKSFLEYQIPYITTQYIIDRIVDKIPVVLNWAIGNTSCHEALERGNCVCGNNSYCTNSSTQDFGYQCHCARGFQGNPYLPDGCQDIDECKNSDNILCGEGGLCVNAPGRYYCICPHGYHNDGDEHGFRCKRTKPWLPLVKALSLGTGLATFVFSLIATGLWIHLKFQKAKKNIIKQKFFKRNGGLLLQQHIASSKTSVSKTKVFTMKELENATGNFSGSRVIGKGGHGTVYKGMLSDGSIVAVKKSNIVDEDQVGNFINEVFILSQINHRNIVKLLGCCLEYEVPLLVYEYISNGTLSHHLHDEGHLSTMSWKSRIRIAAEVAGALAYLHTYASTTIFHRDIKSTNILLDDNFKAIVSDFGLSRLVPFNKTHLTTLVGGTFGYLDPQYFRSGRLTDKSDVYAFGVVLAELLTGEKAVSSNEYSDEGLVFHFLLSMKSNHLFEILEGIVVHEGPKEEILAVANLANRCLKSNGKNRPTMKEVAVDLERLRRIQEQPLLQTIDRKTNSPI